VSIEERHVALPKLYGAPAYARPPAPVAVSPRPFDPDELPLEVFQTEEERESVAYTAARTYEIRGAERASGGANSGRLRGRAFSLRAIAGRLLGGDLGGD
jgi:hypothetical protein